MNRQSRGSAFSQARLALLIGAVVVPTLLSAQEPLWGGDLVSRIDSLAESTLAGGPVAGLSIGVKRGDELLLAKGYGQADVENGVAATAETVYRIGSLTKQFTAVAVMQLVQRGRVQVEELLTRYLPEYSTQGHDVTIRHLLTHTSGIKDFSGLPQNRATRTLDLSDEEVVALFQDEPFDFSPGEQYRYSNSGFYLLGMVIEAVSEQSYRDYLMAHLFGPLGLSGSSYCDERSIIPHRAEGYQVVDGRILNDTYLSMDRPGAAGALCSTVLDLLVWNSALRNGRLVSASSYEQMTTPATLNDGSESAYGFGLRLAPLEGRARVFHTGGIDGFNTVLAYYPESGLDIVVLSNTNGPHPRRIADMIARWVHGISVGNPPE